jgi:transcriptional regulator with XRE-family HTH domain
MEITNYSQCLSQLIAESGLSLREIAEAAKKYKINIDRTYLSKLQNGKNPQPSFKISIALAKVFNTEPEILISAGILDQRIMMERELITAFQEIEPNYVYKGLVEPKSNPIQIEPWLMEVIKADKSKKDALKTIWKTIQNL